MAQGQRSLKGTGPFTLSYWYDKVHDYHTHLAVTIQGIGSEQRPDLIDASGSKWSPCSSGIHSKKARVSQSWLPSKLGDDAPDVSRSGIWCDVGSEGHISNPSNVLTWCRCPTALGAVNLLLRP